MATARALCVFESMHAREGIRGWWKKGERERKRRKREILLEHPRRQKIRGPGGGLVDEGDLQTEE